MSLPGAIKISKPIGIMMLIGGNALLAFDVAAFVVPHDFILGGTTGIAIFVSNLVDIDTALLVLILNIFLLILGRLLVGRKLFFSTVASSVLYPVFLGLFQRIPGIDAITDNTLLAALFSGSLMGVALGAVMRVGATTGGMDILAVIMNKYLHWPISVNVWITDLVVILLQAVFAPAEGILYAILIIVIESVLIERLMLLGLPQIQIFVVSEKYEQMRRVILEELDAGVTLVDIETGCLGRKQKGIFCVIPHRKLYSTVDRLQAIDPTMFMTITQIREARGRGYTLEQDDRDISEMYHNISRFPGDRQNTP